MINRILFTLIILIALGPFMVVLGHNIGARDIEGCINNLKNQCGPLYDQTQQLQKENESLKEQNKALVEDLLECWRTGPMLPHIRGGDVAK